MGNLPRWEDLESQADQVVDEVFSGVEESLMSISSMDLDDFSPKKNKEEAPEEEVLVGSLKKVSRGEWLLLATALSSVVLAGSVWWTQINPTMSAKAQEVPPASPSSSPSVPPPAPTPVAAAPVPTANQEEKILQRYKQDIQATKTALGTKAGNKANPFFPSVKITQSSSSNVIALPPGSQQPFQVPKGQTPQTLAVQPAQPAAQAPRPVQYSVQAPQRVAAVPQRYNIPPLPRILPAPPSLRPLRANGSLPPFPPPIQMQTAAPSPSPLNTIQTAASTTGGNPAPQSIENTQASQPTSVNNPPQVKPQLSTAQPQALASTAQTPHSLIGIMGTGSKRQTALIKSGDSMKEVTPGEQVSGGWTLKSIAENQVTLQQGEQTKVLTLGDP